MAVQNLRPLIGGRILRGSQPFGMDAAATSEFLDHHGIQAVVDLRSGYERAISPWHLENHEVDLVENPLDPRLASAGLDAIHTAEDLAELYLGWVRARPDWVADSLRPVTQGKRTLIHCSLGKDRTGVVSAVALLAIGTAHRDIVADYAASTEALPAMLQTMAAAWRLAIPEVPEDAFSPSLMLLQSPGAAMEYFLEGFTREFGSATGFLRDAGLSAAELDSLRGV